MSAVFETIADISTQMLVDTGRRLGGHADAYDPVKGSLLDGEFELWLLLLVTVLVISLGSLAAGAGIGGGGLFVPLFAFVLGVGAKAAVPMSKATILGGAIGNMMSIAFATHPAKQRPLIDYEASTFMQSGELLGVIFGVLLNMLLPEVAIIVFLALLLSFNGYKTITKGISKYKQESAKIAKTTSDKTKQVEDGKLSPVMDQGQELSCEHVLAVEAGLSGTNSFVTNEGSGLAAIELGDIILNDVLAEKDEGKNTDSTSASTKTDSSPDDDEALTKLSTNSTELAKILKEEAIQFPLWSWALLTLMTVYTIVYAFIKKTAMSTCQPLSYWSWYFSPLPVLLVFMAVTGVILKQRHQRRVKAGYVFAGDGEDKPEFRDMKWTDDSLKKFPSIALLAGVSAGLLGIGGGMVIGPLFIQLDMQPKVGASSCAFMILWTAASGVVQYWFAGKIGFEFIAYGICVGFVSGQLGQRLVDKVLQRTGRPSFVIFLLGGIVCVACAAMTCTGTYKVIKGVSEGEDVFSFDLHDFQCGGGGAGGH